MGQLGVFFNSTIHFGIVVSRLIPVGSLLVLRRWKDQLTLKTILSIGNKTNGMVVSL